MNYRIGPADLIVARAPDPGGWCQTRLPAELGQGATDSLALADGLTLAVSHYRPRHDLIEESVVERGRRALTITVALRGRSSCVERRGGRFEFLAGRTTVAAFGDARAQRRFLADEDVRQLRVIADEELLVRYGCEDVLHTDTPAIADPLFFDTTSACIADLARTLMLRHDRRRREEGEAERAERMDLHIAALSLLSEQCKQMRPRSPQAGRWRPDDRARLQRAHDLILQHYDRPLSIAYLSAEAGINECKLKQGFRQLHGTSPHRLLTEVRMRRAWELLESGLHVSTVAYRVGYQHLASFSAAFSRHFGRTPKSVAGKRQA